MCKRAFLAAGLGSFCILPALPSPKPSKEAEEAKRQAKLFQKKLPKDKQIAHALDRLTFGPEPGDIARVKKTGLKKWVDLQLHPERIPENPDLEAKLQPRESLLMTPMEAVQHYPTPQMIRAIANGRQPMPGDPVLRASIDRWIARYKVKKDGGAQIKGAAAFDPDAELEP